VPKYRIEIAVPKIVVEVEVNNVDQASLKEYMDKMREDCVRYIKENMETYLQAAHSKKDFKIHKIH
jgi:predicted transcriptional regulator